MPAARRTPQPIVIKIGDRPISFTRKEARWLIQHFRDLEERLNEHLGLTGLHTEGALTAIAVRLELELENRNPHPIRPATTDEVLQLWGFASSYADAFPGWEAMIALRDALRDEYSLGDDHSDTSGSASS